MSFAGALTVVGLPPTLFTVLALLCVLLAWRGWRPGFLLAVLALSADLFLSTPLAADLLMVSLEREVAAAVPPAAPAPAAIIVLGGDGATTVTGTAVLGALTLERLRAGAALHRATGLPLLVTGGAVASGAPPIAVLMAESLRADFGVPVRWIEPRAGNTRENAAFSAAMLRAESIDAAYVVSHGWHLPRALWSFEQSGFVARPAPVRLQPAPSTELEEWLPRATARARSWFAVREWAGRLVYALRG